MLHLLQSGLLEYFPSMKYWIVKNGASFSGNLEIIVCIPLNKGRGLRAKVQTKIAAIRFAGGCAAIAIAIGPEKDSPRITNSSSFGN